MSEDVALHKSRGKDVVSSAAKGWVDAGKEVVQVRGKNARKFSLNRAPAVGDQSHREHGPGEPQHGDLNNEELDLLASVVLGVSVSECHD